ncbi:thiosulfate sulfurtransferase 18-like [Oryza brachyantha]|uniref:Rhodanese domain-containing protein n=1 Tax=Oryza brachyantha TaxID=4533 RepID=J3ND33_ORYBR|nr:thiosulfate sulfurtransferase 18-like [Oryza brachyantha]
MGSLRGGGSGVQEAAAEREARSVDAEEACALLSAGRHRYLDVRMWEDFDKGHVAGARNVPYYLSVTPRAREKNPHFVDQVAALYATHDPIIVGCRSGVRSKLATADLVAAGFKNVRNLEGGYLSLLRAANQEPPET